MSHTSSRSSASSLENDRQEMMTSAQKNRRSNNGNINFNNRNSRGRDPNGSASSASSTPTRAGNLQQAVEVVMNSFYKHTGGLNSVDAVEALQEFWQMKETKGQLFPAGGSSCPHYTDEDSDSPPFVTYVVLPGGACFASFEHSVTLADAKRSAAKIALMNSVFNEHPYRKITDTFIQSAVQDALKVHNGPRFDAHNPNSSIGVFESMLKSHAGKTMLEFQETMTIFQLLHWNDSLKAMRARQCSRQEVLSHFSNTIIDDKMRRHMALDWLSREQDSPGVIKRELRSCYNEIYRERREGKELRFLFEKRNILLIAQEQLEGKQN
ncbi:protein limb expression 1 homolog [Symsagittifera roscoffensis]|uniref:protein limb expression 1 homolog n=1 Tax=Symsagittifera roscoffensis TaxID=84072 RepID=UPI00307B4D7F